MRRPLINDLYNGKIPTRQYNLPEEPKENFNDIHSSLLEEPSQEDINWANNVIECGSIPTNIYNPNTNPYLMFNKKHIQEVVIPAAVYSRMF